MCGVADCPAESAYCATFAAYKAERLIRLVGHTVTGLLGNLERGAIRYRLGQRNVSCTSRHRNMNDMETRRTM